MIIIENSTCNYKIIFIPVGIWGGWSVFQEIIIMELLPYTLNIAVRGFNLKLKQKVI